MDLKQLTYFIELAKVQHVSKAADLLNISQPTLSKSLNHLETELGVRLFDRIGNHIVLNTNGQRFYDYAEKSAQLLQAGIMSTKSTIYETTGKISIISWCFAPILMPCIQEYQRLNPMTSVSLLQNDYDTTASSHSDSDYDFILKSQMNIDEIDKAENRSFWISQPLFQEEYVLVIGPSYKRFHELTDGKNSIDITMLKDAPFITQTSSSYFYKDVTYEICQNAGFWPKTYFSTDDFILKIHMLQSGDAIAFIPECCLYDAKLLCPGLRSLHIENYPAKRTVCFQRKKKILLSEASLDFWNFVLDYYNLPADSQN